MDYIPAAPGWLVLDTADGETARVIAWTCGDCLAPVVIRQDGRSGIIPMPSLTHALIWDPVRFDRSP